MKLVSVNCGIPRTVDWHGRNVTTSIYKEQVQGHIALRTLNLDGDRQSDLSAHGGKDKAVYCYPVEQYEYWKVELPGHALPMGAFGENFTTEGLSEESVNIGDRFAVGSAEVVLSQPRLPCYKLGIRFESDDMVKRFLASGCTGFYLAVTREGEVGAGDEIRMLRHRQDSISVPEITHLHIAKEYDNEDSPGANGSRGGSIARELEAVSPGKGDKARHRVPAFNTQSALKVAKELGCIQEDLLNILD